MQAFDSNAINKTIGTSQIYKVASASLQDSFFHSTILTDNQEPTEFEQNLTELWIFSVWEVLGAKKLRNLSIALLHFSMHGFPKETEYKASGFGEGPVFLFWMESKTLEKCLYE